MRKGIEARAEWQRVKGPRFYETQSWPNGGISFSVNTDADRKAFMAAGYDEGSVVKDRTLVSRVYDELNRRNCVKNSPIDTSSQRLRLE